MLEVKSKRILDNEDLTDAKDREESPSMTEDDNEDECFIEDYITHGGIIRLPVNKHTKSIRAMYVCQEVPYDCQSTSIRSQSAPCMYAKRYHTTASQQAYEVNPRHVRTPKEVPYDCQSTSIRSQCAPCTYAKRGTIRLPVNKHTKSIRAMYVRQNKELSHHTQSHTVHQ